MSTATTARGGLAGHVRRVREEQRRWEQVPVTDRLRFISDFRRLLVGRRERLCEALREELGKPAPDALGGDILPLADACRFVEGNAVRVLAPRRNSLWRR